MLREGLMEAKRNLVLMSGALHPATAVKGGAVLRCLMETLTCLGFVLSQWPAGGSSAEVIFHVLT